ncbi:hypothetical protein HU200_053262 [Digitaria exilis]|uniref:Uncharacterized protein n=1 Tax=Digitaria exilis TaxID=1010633 RepID=A0A835E802_9POAL|nr:hypothetical protein HU200_053262 [Digitaria exilis]CAB3459873.1 unnamed protein product [Digitaria exilis]
MPKRHRSSDGESVDHRSCRRSLPLRRHLCVVLDDWSKGYSIYKLDVDGFNPDDKQADDDLDLNAADRLPEPPVFRLEIPEDERGRFARFAAVGSRIFAMHYSDEDRDAPVLVYDLATGGLAVGPGTPLELQNRPKLVAAGDRLYAVDRIRDGRREDHSFKVLAPHGRRGWVWSSLRAAPLDLMVAACHAAHPDGRTVLFSAHGKGTFSVDTETEEWAWLGQWMLPFRGQAYYDGELDAWVGLRSGGVAEGAVCSCQVVVVADHHGPEEEPAWKVVAPQVIKTDDERTMAVELAHMGDGSFCLVECRQQIEDDDGRWLLRTATFGLRYDKDGALRPTASRTRCYAVHKKSNTFQWRAFGI